MKNLHWIDTAKIGLPESLNKDAQSFVDDVLKGAPGLSYLEAKFRATHSGHLIPTRCYTGVGMKAGCPTWYSVDKGGASRFDKPVLLNHDAVGPILGRVSMAEYIQLKQGRDFTDDWKNPDTGLKMGSGYIMLTTDILDPDAALKLVDGRYHTVSTRQDPRDAWCSVCGASFKGEGCDHEIGDYYETEDGESYMCYPVTGFLDYVEMSIVALPNQPNAVKISSKQIQKQLKDSGRVDDIHVINSFSDSNIPVTSLKMTSKKTGGSADLVGPKLPSLADMTGKVQVNMSGKTAAPPGTEIADLEKTVADAAAAAAAEAAKGEDKKEEQKASPEDEARIATINVLESMREFSLLDESLIIKDQKSAPAHIVYKDEAGEIKVTEEDAKLSTEARKKMSQGTFCGPDRSFPVPDCAHYTAALRLLGRAKASDATKAKIKACVMRKGKSLGCDGAKDMTQEDLDNLDKLAGCGTCAERAAAAEKAAAEGVVTLTKAEHDALVAVKAEYDSMKKDLEKKIADAVALSDAAEKRSQSLLADNTQMRVTMLREKASTLVRLRSRIANETLEDSAISGKVDELLKTEDENKINEALKACTMSLVAGKGQVSDAGPARLVADAAAPAVTPVVEQKPEDKKNKSHDNDLDRLADAEYGDSAED